MITVTTKCQNCGTQFQTEYQRLGAAVSCTHCLFDTVPQMADGTVIPVREWDLTYREFRQLIEYELYRPEILPLLGAWFGYRLSGVGPHTLIVNKHDEAIDPLWLHLTIQRDKIKQPTLYQVAMSLWR